jgi:hypothetical protein
VLEASSSCHKTLGIATESLGIEDKTPGIGFQSLGIGHGTPGIGFQSLGVGHESLGAELESPGIGHGTLGIGFQSFGIGHESLGAELESPGIGVETPGGELESLGINRIFGGLCRERKVFYGRLVSKLTGRTVTHGRNMEHRLRNQRAGMGYPRGPHHPTGNRRSCGGEKPHKGRKPTAVFRSPRALLRPKHIQSAAAKLPSYATLSPILYQFKFYFFSKN